MLGCHKNIGAMLLASLVALPACKPKDSDDDETPGKDPINLLANQHGKEAESSAIEQGNDNRIKYPVVITVEGLEGSLAVKLADDQSIELNENGVHQASGLFAPDSPFKISLEDLKLSSGLKCQVSPVTGTIEEEIGRAHV